MHIFRIAVRVATNLHVAVFPSQAEPAHNIRSPRSEPSPPVTACGAPSHAHVAEHAVDISQCLSICSVNMRSVYSKTKRAELEQRLSESRPLIVCLQETWLDDSVSSLCISGYKPISRRDREDGYGGVFIFVREDVEFVVPLCVGVDAEIQLCTIHAACGPLLLCNWYRPPGASEAAII